MALTVPKACILDGIGFIAVIDTGWYWVCRPRHGRCWDASAISLEGRDAGKCFKHYLWARGLGHLTLVDHMDKREA